MRTSEAERRQAAQDIKCTEDIVIELLRNARDAGAKHIFVATTTDQNKRHLIVIDDGSGIPVKMHEKIFEPRVTSKLDTSHMDKWGLHGRGMALFSVHENAEEARVVCSEPDKGTSIGVVTDTNMLGEKTDQSSFPEFIMTDGATVSVRGPRNINRCVCEFALEENGVCDVYLGSPSEIIAVLYEYGRATLNKLDRLFTKDANALPVVKRLGLAADPEDLAVKAKEIGLDVSERTARRIMNESIDPAPNVLSRVRITQSSVPVKNKRKHATSRQGIRITADEKSIVGNAALKGFSEIAGNYYLESDVEAKVQVSGSVLRISIPLIEEDK